MEELEPQQGEFHHFQLINALGDIPVSISVLIHYNRPGQLLLANEPISADEIIDFHDALQQFDGDFIRAFSTSKS